MSTSTIRNASVTVWSISANRHDAKFSVCVLAANRHTLIRQVA
jgi:hypothetical protein